MDVRDLLALNMERFGNPYHLIDGYNKILPGSRFLTGTFIFVRTANPPEKLSVKLVKYLGWAEQEYLWVASWSDGGKIDPAVTYVMTEADVYRARGGSHEGKHIGSRVTLAFPDYSDHTWNGAGRYNGVVAAYYPAPADGQ
jgi:hypothetical protein